MCIQNAPNDLHYFALTEKQLYVLYETIWHHRMVQKIYQHRQLCVIVGYIMSHAGNVNQFIHSHTNKHIYGQEVQGFNKIWGEYYSIQPKD